MAKKTKEEALSFLKEYEGTSKAEKLQRLYDEWFNCQRCELKNFRCTERGDPVEDIVFCSGNPDASIMIIGEAPGEEEASELVPFVGRSGKLLNQILATISDNPEIKELHTWYTKVAHTKGNVEKFHEAMFAWREKELFMTNIVSCRPPENRAPTPPEMDACKPRLQNLIYLVDPVIIISSGSIAASSLIGHKVQVTAKRGELFEAKLKGKVTDVKYPVVVTLHPSYLLRKADWNDGGGDYSKTVGDFAKAFRIADFLNEQHKGVQLPARGHP